LRCQHISNPPHFYFKQLVSLDSPQQKAQFMYGQKICKLPQETERTWLNLKEFATVFLKEKPHIWR